MHACMFGFEFETQIEINFKIEIEFQFQFQFEIEMCSCTVLVYEKRQFRRIFVLHLLDNSKFFDKNYEVARTALRLVLPHSCFCGVGLRPRSLKDSSKEIDDFLPKAKNHQFFSI